VRQSPKWRTEKIAKVQHIDMRIADAKQKDPVDHSEIEKLEKKREEITDHEKSALSILLFSTCDFDPSFRTRSHRRRFYWYYPDLDLDCIENYKDTLSEQDHYRPNMLDLRDYFERSPFGEPDRNDVPPDIQKNRDAKRLAIFLNCVQSVKATIDHLFAHENIKSWDHLSERLAAYYSSKK